MGTRASDVKTNISFFTNEIFDDLQFQDWHVSLIAAKFPDCKITREDSNVRVNSFLSPDISLVIGRLVFQIHFETNDYRMSFIRKNFYPKMKENLPGHRVYWNYYGISVYPLSGEELNTSDDYASYFEKTLKHIEKELGPLVHRRKQ